MAYKSDHGSEDISAQYLLLQAAIGHSFGLPADKALQAVTSVPAKAIDIDNRVGYIRPGYDADLVVWDAHPLAIGTSPKQVYIDGVETLDPAKVEESFAHVVAKEGSNALNHLDQPPMRAVLAADDREKFCANSRTAGQDFVITGITKAFLDDFPHLMPRADGDFLTDNLTLVIQGGKVTCLGAGPSCSSATAQLSQDSTVPVILSNGHLTRGLTTVTRTLGIADIGIESETGDGARDVVQPSQAKDAANIEYAKYAVTLGGSQVEAKSFARARLGGVTRVIQAPETKGGLVTGVSTGMRTGLNSTLLNGGLFQEDVAMHVVLGEESKANEGSVGMAIERLRALVASGEKQLKEDDENGVENPWVLVANGSLPLVITAVGTVSPFRLSLPRDVVRLILGA